MKLICWLFGHRWTDYRLEQQAGPIVILWKGKTCKRCKHTRAHCFIDAEEFGSEDLLTLMRALEHCEAKMGGMLRYEAIRKESP